ncbi:ABC transporter ATP-binding protein, partial [Acidobacteriota bacterium]
MKVKVRDRVKWYWLYWRPYRSFLVFLFFFTVLSSAVAIAYPLAFRAVIDRLAETFKGTVDKGEEIGSIIGILLLIAAGRFVAGFYPSFRAWMNQRLERAMREDVFEHIMKKDHRFFNKFRTGDMVTRLTDDVAEYPKIAWFGCSGVFRAVESGSKFILCLVAMAVINWQLTVLSLIPLPAMFYLYYRLRARMSRVFQEQQKTISKTNDILEATFSGIRIVKAFQAEKGQQKRLTDILEERIDIQYDVAKLWMLIHLFNMLASRVGQAIAIAAGGYMIINGNFTLGGLYAFYLYLDMLVHPMMDLPNLLVTSKQAFVCIDRLEEMKQFPVKEEERFDGKPLTSIEEIAFREVDAGYEEQDRVLSKISFKTEKGNRIAIVGGVGSGKSTILKLIAGLLGTRGGEIVVNGKPLQDWDLNAYRKRIGYVPQEALLFSEPIRDNICMGRELSESDVLRALAIAQIDQEVNEMPGGIEAVPGSKGRLVSGGQRQRIAIARALAANPDVLLLDDCTASLDARLEDKFWSALFEAMPNVTFLVVSHRPATILRAEHIL